MIDLSRLPVGTGVRRRLEGAVQRLSHAYIISGPEGCGKEQLAGYLSAAYVCPEKGDKPCFACLDCRKAEGGIHPDIIHVTVPEGKRNISVEQIRRLRTDAYIRPNEACRKVFLIENAQTMNDSAQNALLKVLEDGPDYLAFLLVTDHPQQLLDTIRSRCELLSLGPGETLPEEDTELEQASGKLAQLMASGECMALAEYTAGLEGKKWDKDTLLALLDGVEAALRPILLKRPHQTLLLMELLRQVRQAAVFNVSAGHLFGWLAAGISDHIGGTKP